MLTVDAAASHPEINQKLAALLVAIIAYDVGAVIAKGDIP